jgi:outer membrane lipoprotein carrier protein
MTSAIPVASLLGGLALVGVLAGQDPDPRAIIADAAARYQAITAFRAEFHQILADSMIGTYDSRGQLVQAGEARLSMRFSDPDGDAIVMDGTWVWVYTPSTTPGQVIRFKIPEDPTFGPNVLAWILTKPTERYRMRYLRADAVAGRGVDVVALAPMDRSLPFVDAVVWIDQYDHLPRRLEIREKGGQTRTLILSGIEVNRRAPADQFQFVPPNGVRVIDQ